MANTYVDAVTKTVDVNGTSFVYRETGEKNGIPIVLLHHLTAVLDDWDPRTIFESIDGTMRINIILSIRYLGRGVQASGAPYRRLVKQASSFGPAATPSSACHGTYARP